jgi:hypothetical protein
MFEGTPHSQPTMQKISARVALNHASEYLSF